MEARMIRQIATLTTFLVAIFAGSLPALAKDAVQPLMYLAGEWAGDGWIDMGQGRMGFRQHERVTPRLDGNIITIEGTGRDPADATSIVFEAFAVLSGSGKPGEYVMRSYTREGQVGTFQAVLQAPGRMVWTIPVPGRKIRYRSEVIGDRWVEVGEASMDEGSNWTKFFEMTLTRVPAR
jgi:hypothetical protein